MKHLIKVEENSVFKAMPRTANAYILEQIMKTTNNTSEIEYDTHYPTKFKVVSSGVEHELRNKVKFLFTESELASFQRIGEITDSQLLEFVIKHYSVTKEHLIEQCIKRNALEKQIAKLEKELNDLTVQAK